LEILGYRYNRAPMLRIAGEFPLADWAAGKVDPEAVAEAEAEAWSLQGVRPANHPRTRLRQYAAWTGARPDWPTRALAMTARLPAANLATSTPDVRRVARLTALREEIVDELCAGAIGGTRLDNVICDGLLPLLATQNGRDFHGLWYHWFAGDLPPLLTSGLRQLGFFDGRTQPACHGAAQGLLGWLLQREPRQ
jgi:hypothetical protein